MQVACESNSEQGEGGSIGNVRSFTRSVLLRSALLWWPANAVRPVLMLCLCASCSRCRTHLANLLLYGRSCPTRACRERCSGVHGPPHVTLVTLVTPVLLGQAPVSFSIGTRNGCNRLATTPVYQQLTSNRARGHFERERERERKISSTTRGFILVHGRRQRSTSPNARHLSPSRLPRFSSITSQGQLCLPSTLIRPRTRKRHKPSVNTCKPKPSHPRSHHVNHSDWSHAGVTSPLDRADRLRLASTPRAF